jgi:hypothetical protein
MKWGPCEYICSFCPIDLLNFHCDCALAALLFRLSLVVVTLLVDVTQSFRRIPFTV